MCIIFKMFISYANLLVQHLADSASAKAESKLWFFCTRNYAKVFRENVFSSKLSYIIRSSIGGTKIIFKNSRI